MIKNISDKISNFIISKTGYSTGERLEQARIKNKLTRKEVSQITNIPYETLRRYEVGEIKTVPKEIVEKLATLYGEPPSYFYGWEDKNFLFIFGLNGMLLGALHGLSLDSISIGAISGLLAGTSAKQIILYYLNKYNVTGDNLPKLNEKEEKEFTKLKKYVYTHLDSETIFDKEEMEDNDKYLLALMYAHKIKREYIEDHKSDI